MWRVIKDGLRKTERKIETTRLESWATPGVPDVLLCSESGSFSFVELKVVKRRASKVDLSPHQCAWITRHAHGSVFVIVREPSLAISIFPASAAVDLRMDKFSTISPLAVFEEPIQWDEFFRLICPGDAV